MRKVNHSEHHGEKGQTIILVAICVVSLLAVAALAIDVVTFYVARSEIQRAADAAAIAGAQGIADSGVTSVSLLTYGQITTAETTAANEALARVTAILQTNPVAGSQPMLVISPPAIDWSRQGNPVITVQLRQTNLPTFFAKIWGHTSTGVTATAVAEVYNPSNNTNYTPIAPTAVKPWFVANEDPYNAATKLVDPATGAIDTGVLGTNLANPFYLTSMASFSIAPKSSGFGQVQYAPVTVTTNTGQNVCPSCATGTDFEESIACADVSTIYSCGSSSLTYTSTSMGGISGPTASGTECLIHASSFGSAGQDTLNFPFPTGTPQITNPRVPYSGQLVTTSNSIVTIPIIDQTRWTNIVIVGFLQAFINQVENGAKPNTSPGDLNITVLNIAGCGGAANTNPPVVGGSGTSPVPVRLITPP